MEKLIGSEKQIKWAEAIRTKQIDHMESFLRRERAEANGDSDYDHCGMTLDFSGYTEKQKAEHNENANNVEAAINKLKEITDSKFFIDTRNDNFLGRKTLQNFLNK